VPTWPLDNLEIPQRRAFWGRDGNPRSEAKRMTFRHLIITVIMVVSWIPTATKAQVNADWNGGEGNWSDASVRRVGARART
jgi:hypothetical protein